MSLWRGVNGVRQTGRGPGESLVRFSVARPRSLASAYRPVSRSARSTATSRHRAGSPLSRQARSRPVTARALVSAAGPCRLTDVKEPG
jgi:hypothetical protein